MQSSSCWYTVFLDAYTYSTKYLLFAIAIIIMSILSVWISEKPRFYKLIYQQSKHSIIDSPVQSNEALETNYIVDCTLSNSDKKIAEPEFKCEYCQCNFTVDAEFVERQKTVLSLFERVDENDHSPDCHEAVLNYNLEAYIDKYLLTH